MKEVKFIKRQDCGWKQTQGHSGETSINLSSAIFDFLSYGMVDCGEECCVTFLIFKEDFIDAIAYIKTQLPLYRSSSRGSEKIEDGHPILCDLQKNINLFFSEEAQREYSVTLYHRKDGRVYLKGLKQNGFSLRDYLVEMSSALIFESSIENGFILRLKSAVSEGDIL